MRAISRVNGFLAFAESACTGATLGVGGWAVQTAIVAGGRHATFAQLPPWVAVGALCAMLFTAAQYAFPTLRKRGSRQATTAAPTSVVILGGGFGGMSTARHLEQLLGSDGSVEITLVSETNALLFTPMLAEVAGSSIEPTHISTPLRSSLRRTNVMRGRVTALDCARRSVILDDGREVQYNHLVLALGSIANFFGQENIRSHALGLRTLSDAIRIRNRVIDLLERADREIDPARRRQLLTFVVAGGGFAGAELAGGLNDFARGALPDYPNIAAPDVAVILVHSGDRILPELSPSLGAYAQQRMTARGVHFRLRAKVTDADAQTVLLSDGAVIPAETLLWTAGAKPHPLFAESQLAVDRRGAVIVNELFQSTSVPGVWALGDCAMAIDPATDKAYPPTAQVAIRQARIVARNIVAVTRGQAPVARTFAALGALCVVGHRTACAELKIPIGRGGAVHFSGTFAWLMWRAIYLAKLPGFDRKVRVLFDWVVELFFPRDIVQTLELS